MTLTEPEAAPRPENASRDPAADRAAWAETLRSAAREQEPPRAQESRPEGSAEKRGRMSAAIDAAREKLRQLGDRLDNAFARIRERFFEKEAAAQDSSPKPEVEQVRPQPRRPGPSAPPKPPPQPERPMDAADQILAGAAKIRQQEARDNLRKTLGDPDRSQDGHAASSGSGSFPQCHQERSGIFFDSARSTCYDIRNMPPKIRPKHSAEIHSWERAKLTISPILFSNVVNFALSLSYKRTPTDAGDKLYGTYHAQICKASSYPLSCLWGARSDVPTQSGHSPLRDFFKTVGPPKNALRKTELKRAQMLKHGARYGLIGVALPLALMCALTHSAKAKQLHTHPDSIQEIAIAIDTSPEPQKFVEQVLKIYGLGELRDHEALELAVGKKLPLEIRTGWTEQGESILMELRYEEHKENSYGIDYRVRLVGADLANGGSGPPLHGRPPLMVQLLLWPPKYPAGCLDYHKLINQIDDPVKETDISYVESIFIKHLSEKIDLTVTFLSEHQTNCLMGVDFYESEHRSYNEYWDQK